MSKKTAFIVYATNDYDLTDAFVNKFKEHNTQFDILYDKNPHSENIYDKLNEYPETCDVAVILACPRLVNSLDHYSNINEIPVLVDRRNRGDNVIIVGVWLLDTDVLEWNKKGDIPFFQLRYGDLRTSRRNDRNKGQSNNEFAVYDLIDPVDRNTYHKELKKWISDIAIKKTINVLPTFEVRTKYETEKIINMIGYNFISTIEKKLSNKELVNYWVNSKISPPAPEDSYAWWFLLNQSKYFKQTYLSVKSQNKFSFEQSAIELIREIDSRANLLLDLCGDETNNELYEKLLALRGRLSELQHILMFEPQKSELVRSRFSNILVKITKILLNLSKEALNYTSLN